MHNFGIRHAVLVVVDLQHRRRQALRGDRNLVGQHHHGRSTGHGAWS